MKTCISYLLGTLALLLTFPSSSTLAQGTTAFNYQGRLNEGGSPANGSYDLRFVLYDAAIGGMRVSDLLTNVATPVTNGLLTVRLDFEAGVFDGHARWLDIGVQTNGGSGFAALAPQQLLMPTPYATMANNASNLLGNVAASQVSGKLVLGQLPGEVLTNNGTGVNLSGSFIGTLGGNAATATSAASAATASAFTGPLAGDVTGTQGATMVAAVGGVTAAKVASGANAANAATSARTPNTLVQRDAAGNFAAEKITATSLSGDGNGLSNLNGASLANGSVGSAQLAANAVQTVNIAGGAVGTGQLAPGAAASNLLAGGQSPVASGSFILCASNNAVALQSVGYVPIAPVCFGEAWTPVSRSDVPSPRIDHLAVWTGREMLIWGGYDGSKWHQDGARYNPFAGTWSPMSTSNAPLAASFAVWTGHEMLVWGAAAYAPARYNPVTDTWTPMSTNGAPTTGGYYGSAVWSGTEMILWGGQTGNNPPVNAGGRYNPVTDTWAGMTTNGAPSARASHSAVWTGTEMIIWGGYYAASFFNTGARYNPATDTWTNLTVVGAPSARNSNAAVWSGTEMIVWGGSDGSYPTTGGRYNPATDTWRSTSTAGVPAGRYWFFNLNNVAVWTGTEMVFWSGYTSGGAPNSGGRYNPTTDVWAAMTAVGAPSPRVRSTAVWADTGMIVFGGWNGPPYPA